MTALVSSNDIDFNGHKGTNLAAPTATSNDAARIVDVETASTNDRARANHTGTQLASTISNFDTQVRTSTLNQMTAPTADLSINSHKITNLTDGSASGDAVNKGQLDAAIASLSAGLEFKGAVEVVHTSNITISNPATSTFDGETITSGQRVWLDGQTTGTEDGPYTFNGSSSAMTRATNWDTTGEAVVGSFWVVKRGTSADRFAILTNDTFTLGTDEPELTITPLSGGTDNDTSYAANVGTGSAGPYSITHSLGSTDVDVLVRELSGGYKVLCAWKPTDTNTVSLEPDETWATDSHRVLVFKVA